MFFNNANCDIYIGKGAGKQLLEELNNAKYSVKVVSPYLSASLVEKLIHLHERNVEVMLITSDDITDFKGKYARNLKKLIIQNKDINLSAVRVKRRLKALIAPLLIAVITYSGALHSGIFPVRCCQDYTQYLPIALLMSMIILAIKGIKSIKTHCFKYSQLFPFKVFLSSETTKNKNDALMHSKIFIIDERIAYLGSLNFTARGTKYNHETRIRTTDSHAVRNISHEVERMMYESDFPIRELQAWGKQVHET